MAYGTEAVIPTELSEATPRVAYFQENDNSEQLNTSLDVIDEVREAAALRSSSYQRQVSAYHQKKVRARVLHVGDLVLRARQTPDSSRGKLAATYEGPYLVARDLGHGAYKLQDHTGQMLNRSWNISNLRLYHK
jgi:hypothetical protein